MSGEYEESVAGGVPAHEWDDFEPSPEEAQRRDAENYTDRHFSVEAQSRISDLLEQVEGLEEECRIGRQTVATLDENLQAARTQSANHRAAWIKAERERDEARAAAYFNIEEWNELKDLRPQLDQARGLLRELREETATWTERPEQLIITIDNFLSGQETSSKDSLWPCCQDNGCRARGRCVCSVDDPCGGHTMMTDSLAHRKEETPLD